MVVVGAGAVGLEMAQALALLGSAVTVLVRSRVLRTAPEQVGEAVQAALQKSPREGADDGEDCPSEGKLLKQHKT